MRVLNRIVTITEEGLLYEPDPRHVEMLARALQLDMVDSNSKATPGIKPNVVEDQPQHDELKDLAHVVAMLKQQRVNTLEISFGETEIITDAPSWYQPVPKYVLLDGPLFSRSSFTVPHGCDPWTGLTREQLQEARSLISLQPRPNKRASILRTVLNEGAAWEIQTTQLLCALGAKKKFKNKANWCACS